MQNLQEQVEKASVTVENKEIALASLPTEYAQNVYAQTEDTAVSVFSVLRNGQEFAYNRNLHEAYAPQSSFSEDQFDEAYETRAHFLWRAPSEPDISQTDAYNAAMEIMRFLQIDLELYDAEPCSVLQNAVHKNTGWQFTFTRALFGLQAQYKSDAFFMNPASLPSYAAPWEREVVRMVIDKEGLCSFVWQGRAAPIQVLVESTQLAAFAYVQERIALQLNYMFGTHENENAMGLDIEIKKIELGISMLSMKDKQDAGIYLPTWYVSYDRKWRDSETWMDPGQIMFSAVDGSYVEPRITNQDIMNNG